MRIFVDMDGTLAKWNNVEFEQLFEKGYYRNLEPNIDLLNDVIQLIENGEDVYILSAYITESEYALKEKQEWVNQYLPSLSDDKKIFVPYGTNKAQYLKDNYSPITSQDYLIDDYTKNLLEWKEYGGIGVKYLNGINHTRGTWQGLKIDYDWTKKETMPLLRLCGCERYRINIPSANQKDEYIKMCYPTLFSCQDFNYIYKAISPEILNDMEYTVFLYEHTNCVKIDKDTGELIFNIADENKLRCISEYILWYDGVITTQDLIETISNVKGENMSKRVKLASTSNPKMMQYQGEYGTLEKNNKGGWDFHMEKGGTISTSAIAPNTTLGELNHPRCKEFSFTTKSGSTYIFDICNRERLMDGCERRDNQFQSYNDKTQEWEFEKE